MTIPKEFRYFVRIFDIYHAELNQAENEAIDTAIKASNKGDRDTIKRFVDGLLAKASDVEIQSAWEACGPTYGYESIGYLRKLLIRVSSKITVFKD
jgi:hypothetical protein